MLEQIVDRSAVILNHAAPAKPVTLPSDSKVIRGRIGAVLNGDTTAGLLPSVDRVRWEYLAAVLALCGGSISEVARRTGVPRRTVQRLLTYKRAPTR